MRASPFWKGWSFSLWNDSHCRIFPMSHHVYRSVLPYAVGLFEVASRCLSGGCHTFLAKHAVGVKDVPDQNFQFDPCGWRFYCTRTWTQRTLTFLATVIWWGFRRSRFLAKWTSRGNPSFHAISSLGARILWFRKMIWWWTSFWSI